MFCSCFTQFTRILFYVIYIYFVEDFFSLCHLHFSHWICWCCFFTSSMLPVFFVRSRIYFNIKLTLHQLPISMHEISTLRMCVHVRLLFWTRTKRIIYDACTTKLMADYFIVYIWFSTGKKWKQNILIYRFFLLCHSHIFHSIDCVNCQKDGQTQASDTNSSNKNHVYVYIEQPKTRFRMGKLISQVIK